MWAAGNGGRDDSCAADGYVNSIYTVAIGAAFHDGSVASFDEECSGKMATTFVSRQDRSSEIVSKSMYVHILFPYSLILMYSFHRLQLLCTVSALMTLVGLVLPALLLLQQ